jgi:hypothetical protein
VRRRSPLPFAAAIALSAFLLFSVEPLVGRLVLPAFGGGPGVWAVVLVCFQAALLIGYGYAHLSVTRLGARRGAPVHLALLAAAIVVLLVAPGRYVGARIDAIPPALDLLRLLGLGIGLPAIALAASTPLLSGWLAALRPALGTDRSISVDGDGPVTGAVGGDPYRLYAVSNAGSLIAVVAYPFLVEPLLGLTAQRAAFLAGFVLLFGLVAICAIAVRSAPDPVAVDPVAVDPALAPTVATPDPPDRTEVLRWILLAAVPAGLLSAVTNLITTDLLSAPLLWIGPLGIYLLTLVIAFGGRGPAIARRLAWLVPIAVAVLAVPYAAPTDWPVAPLLLTEGLGFGLVALVLHGGLAGRRPAPAHLTGFYLAVALGGVIGGAFVGLVAPSVFPAIWEYPILLVGALAAMAVTPELAAAAAAPLRRRRPPSRILDLAPATAGVKRRLTVYLLIAGALAVALTLSRSISTADASSWLLIGAAVLVFAGEIRIFTVVMAAVLVIAILTPLPALFRERSFFGVVEVLRPEPAEFTVLRHGTTVHGLQATDPASAEQPIGYFSRVGPLGDAFAYLDLAPDATAPRHVLITGLGAGTIAAYARPGDAFRFVEIDPLIVRVAEDPSFFTYLSGAASPPTVVVADGRLELEQTAPASEQLVILDAFTSDVIPVHLLTREALASAWRAVAPGGLIAVNISSRTYALGPTVAAGLAPDGVTVLERLHDPTPDQKLAGITTSDWLVGTTDPTTVAWFKDRGWQPVAPAAEPLTDDRSDLLRLLRPGALW